MRNDLSLTGGLTHLFIPRQRPRPYDTGRARSVKRRQAQNVASFSLGSTQHASDRSRDGGTERSPLSPQGHRAKRSTGSTGRGLIARRSVRTAARMMDSGASCVEVSWSPSCWVGVDGVRRSVMEVVALGTKTSRAIVRATTWDRGVVGYVWEGKGDRSMKTAGGGLHASGRTAYQEKLTLRFF